MTPDKWSRMSWHQRARYLHQLTQRERWINRETQRLNGLRQQLEALMPTPVPFDPDVGVEEARRLHALITPDPAEEIQKRQQYLLTIRGH